MNYVFEPPSLAIVPVANSSEAVVVRRIYCVGRNYAAHVREMGGDPDREPPFFFCKPADSIVYVAPGQTVDVSYPPKTHDYQHEIELVVVIGKRGRDIAVERVGEYVWGYAVGLDMTRRDLQLEMRASGRPWELGKAFDQSAPIGPIVPAEKFNDATSAAIWVLVDGQDRQRSDLAKLIWSVPEVVANLSTYFELQPGDLIFTGTPEGVGPVQRGQLIHGGINGLGEIKVKVI